MQGTIVTALFIYQETWYKLPLDTWQVTEGREASFPS